MFGSVPKKRKLINIAEAQSEVRGPSCNPFPSSNTTLTNACSLAAQEGVNRAIVQTSTELRSILKDAVDEITSQLKTQYESKLQAQQKLLDSCLLKLEKITADVQSQRELDLRRELIQLKQKEAMQSDKYFVYDVHLTHA